MIEKSKTIFGVLLTDLSKAFDCIPEKLLTARVSDHIFGLKALEFICSNINSRKEKVKINKSFNE